MQVHPVVLKRVLDDWLTQSIKAKLALGPPPSHDRYQKRPLYQLNQLVTLVKPSNKPTFSDA